MLTPIRHLIPPLVCTGIRACPSLNFVFFVRYTRFIISLSSLFFIYNQITYFSLKLRISALKIPRPYSTFHHHKTVTILQQSLFSQERRLSIALSILEIIVKTLPSVSESAYVRSLLPAVLLLDFCTFLR